MLITLYTSPAKRELDPTKRRRRNRVIDAHAYPVLAKIQHTHIPVN